MLISKKQSRRENKPENLGRKERSKERPGSATSSLIADWEAERMWEEGQETDNEDSRSINSTKTIAASLEKRNSGSIRSKSRSKSGERSSLGEMLRSRLGRSRSSEVGRSRLGRSRSEEEEESRSEEEKKSRLEKSKLSRSKSEWG